MNLEITSLFEQIPSLVALYGVKIITALAIYIIGKWFAEKLAKLFATAMNARGVDKTVAGFVRNISYYAMVAVIFVAALGQLGVQTTSFVAIVGAAGLAIGLALKDSLANFASGVMLILFRPFRAGDYIEAAGTAGIVREISIFSSTLTTPDNKRVIVPNGRIYQGNIINYSCEPERRIDLVIGVSYSSNLQQVKDEIRHVIDAEERVLKEKDTVIGVDQLADSSINLVVRTWVKSADFGMTRFALIEAIKNRFDEVGIEIPFPQMDVHLSKPE